MLLPVSRHAQYDGGFRSRDCASARSDRSVGEKQQKQRQKQQRQDGNSVRDLKHLQDHHEVLPLNPKELQKVHPDFNTREVVFRVYADKRSWLQLVSRMDYVKKYNSFGLIGEVELANSLRIDEQFQGSRCFIGMSL